MSRELDWLPEVLRAAGMTVVLHEGWAGRASSGARFRPTAVVWHHDASPPGDSPGVPRYMARELDAGRAGAQCWVDRQGRWHIVAAGIAYHAGRTRRGAPGNGDSIGVETDHTTGEEWPDPLLRSLRVGTAAILRHLAVTEAALEFHATICDPPGRKTDPDGLSLATERAFVARLLRPPPRASRPETRTAAPTEGETMYLAQDTITKGYWLCVGVSSKGTVVDTATLAAFREAGVREIALPQRQIDAIPVAK